MKSKLDYTNISALKFNEEIAEKVDQICVPLSRYFGVTHFGYIRIFKDGRMLRIANNQAWTRTYFEKAYYNDLDLYSMRDVPENESRLLVLTGEPQTEHCKLLCKEFKIWNALAIYQKFGDYSDFWFFASSPHNTEIINFYMNNTDTLRKFTLHFKDKFAQDLKTDDPTKLIVSNLEIVDNPSYEKEKVRDFFNTLNISSYQIDDHLSISKKEFECLFYLVQGKTMKEIARFLNVSFRTIEFHLNNIKRKTNCYKKSQMIELFLENKVFYSLLSLK